MKFLSLYNQAVIEAFNKGYRITFCGLTLNPKGDILKGGNLKRARHKTTGSKQVNRRHSIKVGNKSTHFKAHRLQAYQKFGNAIFKPGIVVRHMNDNTDDLSWGNIEIGTQADNMKDKMRNLKNKL